MPLTLGNLDTRFQFLVGDTSSGSQTNRYNALADADVELSSIKGFWRVRSHAYTTSSSPAMAAGDTRLSVPTSPAFELPYRLYYRESGIVKDVLFKSRSEWLELSDTSQSDYPRWACLVQTASGKSIDLDRQLSAAFISNIATLTLEYFIEITRLSASGNESILPDSLRHHILPVAAVFYGTAQGDGNLVERMRPEAERAREAVLRFDIEQTARPRQIRPMDSYAPADMASTGTDYGMG